MLRLFSGYEATLDDFDGLVGHVPFTPMGLHPVQDTPMGMDGLLKGFVR